jgi:2-oxoglutarate ferredoxin oxidoreductase subunit alpha
MTEKRFRKLESAMGRAPEALRYGDPGANVGVITWGSTAGAVVEAVDLAREEGIAVELLAPKMLRPLPDHQIAPFVDSKRVVLVPEVNYSGQFADMLSARYHAEFRRVNTYGGTAFKVGRLLEVIREVSGGSAPRIQEEVRSNAR